MGCGISKIDLEEAGCRPKRSQKRHHHVHGNHRDPIRVEEADDFANDHHNHGGRKSVSSLNIIGANKGHCKDSSFCEREDSIGFSASPSFREYCVDRDSINDGNGGREEMGSQGGRASNVEKFHLVEQERPFISEKVNGSRSPERHTKSTRKGFKSAMQKPAGWLGKNKK